MRARNARRLPEPLGASAGRFAARPAVTAREGLRTRLLTDQQLHAAADVVAASLTLHHGLRRGEGVILLPPSGVRAVCVLFGLIRADVVAVPLDLNATPAFVGAVAQKTDSAAAIVARGLPAPAGLTRIAIEDLPPLRGAEPPAADVMRDEVAEIAFISRTTGDPKGVVLTHGNNTRDLESATSVVPRG
jgi:syringomycin synthetase protein SyrB1